MTRHTAIVLAAGKGTRMNSTVPKQYMDINGYPVLYYSLKKFEESFVDDIIIVTGKNDTEYVKKEIVDKYSIKKVSKIIEGGANRYDSVYEGLKACSNTDYVHIHDGARPCIEMDMLLRIRSAVEEYKACVLGMPVKDTIKVIDNELFAVETPDRNTLWLIQTPQSFEYSLIMDAYKKMYSESRDINITDDAMIIETFTDKKIKVVEGSYSNIKITTNDDIPYVEKKFKKI